MKKILLVFVSFMMFSAFAEPMFKWSNELGFSPINLEKEDSGKNVGVNFDFYGGEYNKTTVPIYWKIHN